METYVEFEDKFIPVDLVNGLLCCADCAILNQTQPFEACLNNPNRGTK